MNLRAYGLAFCSIISVGCQAETFTSHGSTGLEVVHGPPPMVSLGTELDTLLLVRVVDEAGEPVQGVAVAWKVFDGDGELIPTAPLSGVDGLASARWKFGMIPGLKRAQVSVAGLDPVTFSTEARGFRAVQVTAGYGHGCALDLGGAAWCFGGEEVENGGISPVDRYRPVQVPGGHQFAEIRAGDSFTCGRTASGEVWCWGYNFGNALAAPGITGSATPLRITGLPPARLLRAGATHACTLATDSTTWCWGTISDGFPYGNTIAAPTQLVTALKFVDLAPGHAHTCGLTAAQETYCWGRNADHQLGDSGGHRSLPTTPVLGGHQFNELHSGDNSTCGRTTAGRIWCWGTDGVRPAGGVAPEALDVPPALGFSVAFNYLAVNTLGGQVQFLPDAWGQYTLPAGVSVQGIAQFEGRGSYCMLTRDGSVMCSGSVVDGGSCSALAPYGCAGSGPVPLPTGGRIVEWWDR